MPFIQRVVEPIYLSRQSLYKEDGEALVKDYELEAVTNNSLSNALRQLASLVLIANDIFDDLAKQLQDVCARSNKLRTRINVLEENVLSFDPKKVTVPESDICSFSLRTEHFASCREPTTALFVAATRPDAVRRLYAAAARTPVHVMRQMDRHRHDGRRSSRFFTCTPVLGAKRRHPRLGVKPRDAADAISNIDIETHMPAAVVALRRWTSAEALGDVTVTPDCVVQRRDDALPLDETDHRLPSPEEQLATVALRFPAEVVTVDVSGKAFQRMSLLRRSQAGSGVGASQQQGDARTRRKPRGRRRNTIAGTDRKEIHKALAGSSEEQTTIRSASTDLLRASSESPPDSGAATATRKALQHLNSLKQWGKVKLRLIRPGRQAPSVSPDADPPPIYESVAPQRRQLPISTPLTGAMGVAVKLREKRNTQAAHSSSGNWSQSSESGRASLGSSTTTTSHPPKSTTTMPNTSASSSVSEGTLTPDLSSVATRSHFADDGETSSVYSCDTEGYYTSFHVDSGLKTLKEEETSSSLPQTPLHSTSALSPGASLTAESEYELFGKGSTSTTTSSAGTVCTTLAAAPSPAVPERKSSLVVSAMVHEPAAESPDSGHNTSSSPVESASPQGTMGRGSECDFSESDLEGVDRIERIRVKTTINSSRIPSMCVITPPQSDDEVSLKAPTSPRPEKRSHAESPVDAVRNQLNSMLGKVKDALTAAASRKSPAPDVVDAGDYVTIADVRGGNARAAPLYSNATPFLATRETEYVSLNDLPKPRAAAGAALLTSPSDSLERKKRQGARVTLDSEGKVVYSSDSLKRNKGAHTTFEPGPYVKEVGVVTPTASPLPTHRAPKANIRPVQLTNRAVSPTSPQLGKVIIRAGSKTPTAAMPPTSRPMSPLQQQQQPPRGAYVNVQSPERCVSPRTAQEEEEGYPTGNRIRTPQPPRYVSPPHPPWPQTFNRSSGPSDAVLSAPAYWTLPTRRPQEHLRNPAVDVNASVQLQTAGNGRFNTIAASSNVNRLHKFYGAQNFNNLNNGAYTSSHNGEKQSTFNVVPPSYEQSPRKPIMSQIPGRYLHNQTPASIPTVPRNNATYFSPRDNKIQSVAQMFTSSTPTKDGNALMDMSTNYSPIQRQTEYNRMQIPDINSALMVNKRNVLQDKPAENCLPQQLTPKKTMTAEELFAAIHKSKKRLNIKTDFDTYSRSGSPSCSSVNSLSPGSSESSINGKRAQPEQGSFASDKNRNRHSWSPNNEDIFLENMQRSYSPTVGTVGSRQSWACDRAGLPSQTSRNDFKRLLLQHGSKSIATQVSGHQGSSRMSAVEQLKLSRQQNTNGYYNPRNPTDKRSNSSKLLQSPRSAANWRFASPRTDILSTTILEDCAEDEDNSTPSPKHSEQNKQVGKNVDNYSVKNVVTNSNVRRPLEMSFGPSTQKPMKAEGLKKHDISAILQQYQNKSPVTKQSSEGIIGSKVVSSPSNNILNIKTSAPHAKPHSTIVLSPSNVKENLNSNQFNYPTGYSNYMNKSLTESNNTLPSTFKSPQLILQQQRAMRMSPIGIQTAVERQKLNYNGSPGRPVLASIDTKSPMQSTLETAL